MESFSIIKSQKHLQLSQSKCRGIKFRNDSLKSLINSKRSPKSIVKTNMSVSKANMDKIK